MIIDFHTHIFPDGIAKKSVKLLEEEAHLRASADGTLNGLKESMRENHIDLSIVMPVVTKPSQFVTVNSFAAEINNREGILSFGGIHPDTMNYKEELDTIKKLGLPGVKLHPDYQKTFIDEERIVRIIDYAASIGLIVLIHAGVDIGLPDPVHCPPDRAANMLNRIDRNDAKIVLAHTGGYEQWDEVEEYLTGRNVWFDLSFSFGRISDEQFIRIVSNHGADRILFATDSPWDDQGLTYNHLMKLDFTEEERERILYRNALELLGMDKLS